MLSMRLYGIALFVHILGVIALFGGISLQQRAGSRLRRSGTNREARRWVEVLEMSRTMPPAGAGMLLVTGAYLAHVLAGGEPVAWIVAAAGDTLLIGILAVAVLGRDIRRLEMAIAAGDGALSEPAEVRIGSRATWGSLGAVNGAALGTLWLMVMKPDALEAVIAATLPVLAGAVMGSMLRASPHLPAPAGAATQPSTTGGRP